MLRTLPLGMFVAVSLALAARAQETIRFTVDSRGTEGDDSSSTGFRPATSDGAKALVVFHSSATNLVVKDLNGRNDIFLHDLAAGTTTRIVLDFNGNETDGDSTRASITPDGRYVVFESDATALVKSDTNSFKDVFVLDRQKGVVERVSISDAGTEADGSSFLSMISDDGRYVAFLSAATNLVANDGNGRLDVFLRDRTANTTICASVDTTGVPAEIGAGEPWLTPDGAFIAFSSNSTDLVPNDTNNKIDIFVRDLAAGVTTRASVNEGGFELDQSSIAPSLSADGSLLVFQSNASNLHPDVPSVSTQAYVKSLATGEVWLASRGIDDLPSNDTLVFPVLMNAATDAAAEPVVAFWSLATNLSDDGNDDIDLFAVRPWSGVSQCLSVDSDGIDTLSSGFSIITPLGIAPEGDACFFSTNQVGLVANDASGEVDGFRRGVQWTALEEFGDGLAGAGGEVPHLTGRGGSCEAGRWFVQVEDGRPQAFGHLWVGFGRTNGLPLFGGTFYVDFAQPLFAVPILLDGPLGVFGAGELFLDGVNVEDLGDFSLFLQCTFLDDRAPKGVSLSNALEIAIDA